MFTKDSRYADVPTLAASDATGREVTAVRLRRLPETGGGIVQVTASDQLDVIADQCYGDASRFWHIADANSEIDALDLMQPIGRPLIVPER